MAKHLIKLLTLIVTAVELSAVLSSMPSNVIPMDNSQRSHHKVVNHIQRFPTVTAGAADIASNGTQLANKSLENDGQKQDGEHCNGNYLLMNTGNDFQALANCSRVTGFVAIMKMNAEGGPPLDTVSLPKLTEISDYLLIYHIDHVRHLTNWFPNLKAIRGRTLFYGYALVIYHLPSVRHLGFPSLGHIKGGVRIEKVPQLCISRESNDYRLLAKAMAKHSTEPSPSVPSYTVPNKPALDGLRVTTARPDNILLEWPNGTAGANGTYRVDVRQIFDYGRDMNETIVDKRSCHVKSQPNVLNLDEERKCRLRADKSGQWLVFYYMGHDPHLDGFGTLITAHNFVQQSHDIDNDTTVIPYDPPIYHTVEDKVTMVIPGASTWANITKLRQFTSYYIILKVCNGTDCKDIAHLKTKTLPSPDADIIYDNTIEAIVSDGSVTITWAELDRSKTNGQIISYDFQFHEPHTKNRSEAGPGGRGCLNHWEYMLANRSFTLHNLTHGLNYSYRLRVNTVHGPGQWTDHHYFYIPNGWSLENSKLIIYITVGLTVVFIGFVLLATVCYLKAPKKSNSLLEIISVNPEYEKFIVDPEYEVNSKDLKTFQVLGDGAFGRVYYGELRTNNKVIKCAVKTLTSAKGAQQRESFLKEANIMKAFVNCHHIVKLIGIVSVENPVLVLMEYMVNGDLKNYLRLNRPDSDENPNPRVPTISRIFQMAIEIADGMAYLAARKFVHRDLAARNCMVAEDLTVKIGDFGMTRDIYDADYYRKMNNCLIPVRWMSPESLKDGLFTTYSDIWAYGVVLSEIVTLGAQPYQGYSNELVLKNVIKGMRLPEPDNCPRKLWRIMQFCWRRHPKARPSFTEITEYLLPLSNQSFKEKCYYLNNSTTKTFGSGVKRPNKSWYSWMTTNRLILNDLKPGAEIIDDTTQYCPMSPVMDDSGGGGGGNDDQRDSGLVADMSEQQIKILNKLNDEKSAALEVGSGETLVSDDSMGKLVVICDDNHRRPQNGANNNNYVVRHNRDPKLIV